MADIEVTGRFKGESIEQGLKKVESGTQRLSKSTRRSGMAFLEATRALEDFQFAGIRGAANNLPGLAMALGFSTGIAGATTIAAVGFLQLTNAMKAFEKQVSSTGNASRAWADSMMRSVEEFQRKGDLDKLTESLEAMKASVEAMASEGEGAGLLKGAEEAVNAIERQIELERELATIRGDRELPGEKFARDAEKAQKAADIYDQTFEFLRISGEQLAKQRALGMEGRSVDKDELYKQEVRIAKAQAELAKAEKLMESKGDNRAQTGMEYFGGKLGSGMRALFGEETHEKVLERRGRNAVELAKQLLAEKKREFDMMKTRYEAEEAALNRIGEAQKTNAMNQSEAQRQLNAARQAYDEAILKKEVAEGVSTERTGQLFTSPLSAQARAGLSGNEIASAMNSLAVQRDMLRELTAINRNTKNNKTATWR